MLQNKYLPKSFAKTCRKNLKLSWQHGSKGPISKAMAMIWLWLCLEAPQSTVLGLKIDAKLGQIGAHCLPDIFLGINSFRKPFVTFRY
jgi:hypothetical protein